MNYTIIPRGFQQRDISRYVSGDRLIMPATTKNSTRTISLAPVHQVFSRIWPVMPRYKKTLHESAFFRRHLPQHSSASAAPDILWILSGAIRGCSARRLWKSLLRKRRIRASLRRAGILPCRGRPRFRRQRPSIPIARPSRMCYNMHNQTVIPIKTERRNDLCSITIPS